jgi:hypothetical protein
MQHRESADAVRSREWRALYEALSTLLESRGRSSAFGDGDYWLLDDNYGNGEHLLYIFQEPFLTPDLIYEIRDALRGFGAWKVVVSMDVTDWDRNVVPPMGLVISATTIKDELRREFLTGNLKNVSFS